MKLKLCSIFLLLLSFNFQVISQEISSDQKNNNVNKILGTIRTLPNNITKELTLGNILAGRLQMMHYSDKKLDDDLSKEAFKVYLERIDYGKQFLLSSDVKRLEKYRLLFDDQMKNGSLKVVDETNRILTPRIKNIQSFVEETLKKPVDLNKKETYETDPKKRDYLSSFSKLKERWRKILKLEIINRILDLSDPIDDNKNEKKVAEKKDQKKEKKLSPAELEKKAREKVAKSYKRIFKRLLDEKRDDKLDKFYNAVTKVFDPHTNYLIPDDKEDFDIDMSGQLMGIGALLREETAHIKVERIIPGSASWKGKELKAEDIILAVGQGDEDPVDIVDMGLRDAVKLIRGKKGTEVRLTVKKPDGTIKVISIIRDVVVIEESYARSSIIEHKEMKSKIGYIYVPKFYRDFKGGGRNCSDDVRKELERLKKSDVSGVILDLRNNGGGALEDARIMSGLFIPQGPIVQTRYSKSPREVLSDADGKVYFGKPLIVLVNRFSASASEILAAAMQDYKRALIVGSSEHTHGKGTVQAVIDLDNSLSPIGKKFAPLGALKITIQMFYRITGGSTQFKGVTPDIVLPDEYGYIDSGERSLDYAIPYSEVEAEEFDKWTKTKFNIKELRKNSEKRVKKSQRFKKVVESTQWYEKRKNQSKRVITLDALKQDRILVKKKSEEFKNEEKIKELIITPFIEAKDDVGKEKKQEFVKKLQTDPVIEETMFIMADMLKANS